MGTHHILQPCLIANFCYWLDRLTKYLGPATSMSQLLKWSFRFILLFLCKSWPSSAFPASSLCETVFVILILIWPQNSEAMVSIDMPAGPSEVLVIADKYANPVHVAADLLSQVSSFPVTLFCCVENFMLKWPLSTIWNIKLEDNRSQLVGQFCRQSMARIVRLF